MQQFNIAQLLNEAAGKYGDRRALYEPCGKNKKGGFRYRILSFKELNVLTNAYAEMLSSRGVTPGMHVLMLVKPGLEFAAAVFAVYRTGAVPILIDPGMGSKNLRGCIRTTAPEAMVAISAAHWFRKWFKLDFQSVRLAFSLGRAAPSDCLRLEQAATPEEVMRGAEFEFSGPQTTLDDPAAIVFTTGSTGPPKGVIYAHRTFRKQIEIIREVYGADPEHVDMSGFPLFALFAIVLGMPSVIPRMDFTRPAQVNPKNIISAITEHSVSFSFGSPALWRTVCSYCLEHNILLPSLKKVLLAGAPVSVDLHRMLKQIIAPDGETLVPYGATEALPIANFTGSEMIAETAALTARGKGYCVGYTNPGVEIRVIACVDEHIPVWRDDLTAATLSIGEIVVKGDVVKKSYFNAPGADAASTIPDPTGGVWHRMGDMGYFDKKKRLWFCGRKSHRVITPQRTYYSVCSEAIFNRHADVFRSALVADGTDSPVLFVEPEVGRWPAHRAAEDNLIRELKQLGAEYDFTREINKFILRKRFPVDIRHNAKIFREKLAQTARNFKLC